MGICSGSTILGSLLLITGIISTGSIITGGISIVKHFNDYSCGNLNYGILFGILSSVIFILNLLLCAISCVKKSSLIIPSLCIIACIMYNVYLLDNISNVCKSYYQTENKKLWDFYTYYLISLIIEIILIIIIVLLNCCKKKNKIDY